MVGTRAANLVDLRAAKATVLSPVRVADDGYIADVIIPE